MRTKSRFIVSSVIAIALLAGALISPGAFAQKKSSAIKIGTYDSRIVTFAWSRADYLKQYMVKINQQSDSAKKANDTARVKEISVRAMSFQHLLHQMVFSNGSAGWIMALIKDKLPELANTAGVSVIVSKWELNFSDPSIEVVDLTSQVAALFQPQENIDQMAGEISKESPVPIDELGIETEMLDGYCKLFGKK
jgi:hypothetical protein